MDNIIYTLWKPFRHFDNTIYPYFSILFDVLRCHIMGHLSNNFVIMSSNIRSDFPQKREKRLILLDYRDILRLLNFMISAKCRIG